MKKNLITALDQLNLLSEFLHDIEGELIPSQISHNTFKTLEDIISCCRYHLIGCCKPYFESPRRRLRRALNNYYWSLTWTFYNLFVVGAKQCSIVLKIWRITPCLNTLILIKILQHYIALLDLRFGFVLAVNKISAIIHPIISILKGSGDVLDWISVIYPWASNLVGNSKKRKTPSCV